MRSDSGRGRCSGEVAGRACRAIARRQTLTRVRRHARLVSGLPLRNAPHGGSRRGAPRTALLRADPCDAAWVDGVGFRGAFVTEDTMRRSMMAVAGAVVGIVAAAGVTVPPALLSAAQPAAQVPSALARPTPQQVAWHDLELGMFIHLGPQTWQDSESDRMNVEPSAMNPAKLDTDQWVRTAEAMGAKYIVFVAKHEGGFCWWQTDTTDFGVRNSPWRGGKGDVLADLCGVVPEARDPARRLPFARRQKARRRRWRARGRSRASGRIREAVPAAADRGPQPLWRDD